MIRSLRPPLLFWSVTLACTLLLPSMVLAQSDAPAPTTPKKGIEEPDRKEPFKGGSTSPARDSLEQAKLDVGVLLSGYHDLPSAEEIKKASPRARAALESIALDQDVFLLQRRRALLALVDTWPDAANQAILETLIASEDDALILESLNLGVKHFGTRGVDMLTTTLLGSSFVTHRRAAIHALAQLPEPQQKKLIAQALPREQDADTKTLLTFKARDLGVGEDKP